MSDVRQRHGLAEGLWPKTGRDNANTSRGVSGRLAAFVAFTWRPPDGETMYGGPVIGADGTAYVVAGQSLCAISTSGILRWSLSDSRLASWVSPTIAADGTIYVPSGYGVAAVSPGGWLKWFTETGFNCGAVSISKNGTLYCGAALGTLYALNPGGRVLWRRKLGGPERAAPAIGPDGRIYVGSDDHRVYALTPSGKTIWSFQTRWKVQAPISLAPDGTVYAPSLDGTLYALNRSGKLLWKFDTRNLGPRIPVGRSLMLGASVGPSGALYFTGNNEVLYALNKHGRLLWTRSDVTGSTPAVARDGTIYILEPSDFVALSPSGRMLWRVNVALYLRPNDACLDGDPAIGLHGWVYAIGLGGPLFAIE